jgi:hypothetical protein
MCPAITIRTVAEMTLHSCEKICYFLAITPLISFIPHHSFLKEIMAGLGPWIQVNNNTRFTASNDIPG